MDPMLCPVSKRRAYSYPTNQTVLVLSTTGCVFFNITWPEFYVSVLSFNYAMPNLDPTLDRCFFMNTLIRKVVSLNFFFHGTIWSVKWCLKLLKRLCQSSLVIIYLVMARLTRTSDRSFVGSGATELRQLILRNISDTWSFRWCSELLEWWCQSSVLNVYLVMAILTLISDS